MRQGRASRFLAEEYITTLTSSLMVSRIHLSFQGKMSSRCGRYTLYETKDLGPRFNLTTQPKFVSQDNYNVAPSQWLPVIIEDPEHCRIAEPMQWGFIPPWSNDPSKGPRPINTKSETVFNIPMWNGAIAHHHCLLPTRAFYDSNRIPEN